MSSGENSGQDGSRNKGDSRSNGETHRSRSSCNFYSDEKEKILNQLSEAVRIELEDTHWQIASYSPLQFVIAHKDLKRIVHAYITKVSTEMETSGEIITREYETLTYHKVTLDAIPTAVVREISPPGFESAGHRYSITFDTNGYNKKAFTIKCKTLEEIDIQLRQMSLVPESRAGFDDLCKIVASFDKTKSTTVREDLETPGFYIIEGKLKAYHLMSGECGSLPKQPNTVEINKCIDVIERLVTKYKRRELVPTALKWGLAAPFSFALRQYTEDSYHGFIHTVGLERVNRLLAILPPQYGGNTTTPNIKCHSQRRIHLQGLAIY